MVFDDARKELPHSGVYRWREGALQLLITDLSGPSGLAFSPDERFLYVGNWDEKRKVLMRYPLSPDGTLSRGEVFADMTPAPGEDALDGVKVDRQGNVYASGPGGIWIFSPADRWAGPSGPYIGSGGPSGPRNKGRVNPRPFFCTAYKQRHRFDRRPSSVCGCSGPVNVPRCLPIAGLKARRYRYKGLKARRYDIRA
jgi:hypothetical protein